MKFLHAVLALAISSCAVDAARKRISQEESEEESVAQVELVEFEAQVKSEAQVDLEVQVESEAVSSDSEVHDSSGVYVTDVHAVNQNNPNWPSGHDRVSTGLAFSGGGSRSMSCTMGALRALQDLGLMSKVDAISAVSGGSWASSIYMFSGMSTSSLLGPPTTPSKLTLTELNTKRAAMGEAMGSRVKTLLAKNALLGRSTAWEKMVASRILAPFGLGDRNSFMAGSSAHKSAIISKNPGLSSSQFNIPRSGRPKCFIIGGVVAALSGKQGIQDFAALQMSPDYTGSPMWPMEGGKIVRFDYKPKFFGGTARDIVVGGGMVESFAFGGKAPDGGQDGKGYYNVPAPSSKFSLATAVGISSDLVFFPERHYWPILPRDTHQDAYKFQLADGGFNEITGLLALMQRNAKRAAVWFNTGGALSTDIDFCRPPSGINWDEIFDGQQAVAQALSSLFGYNNSLDGFKLFGGGDVAGGGDPWDENPWDGETILMHNRVFQKSLLVPLLCDFQKMRAAGKPMVALREWTVQKNEWWGIAGGYKMKILMVMNSPSKEFEAQLPSDTRNALEPSNAAKDQQFMGFPLVATQQHGDPVYLKRQEVALLAAYHEWIVRSNVDLFKQVFY